MDKNCKILVVDDVEAIRSFVRLNLVRLGFQHVDTASNEKVTLEKMALIPYNLAFLDINLCSSNGLGLLNEIRQSYPDCIVVMCSANNTEENVRGAIAAGAQGFLAKPVTPVSLIGVLNRLN